MLDNFKDKLKSALPVTIESKKKPQERVYRHVVIAEVVGKGKDQESYYIFKCPRVQGGELVQIYMKKHHRPLHCPVCGDKLPRDCFTGDMPPPKNSGGMEAALESRIAVDGKGYDIG